MPTYSYLCKGCGHEFEKVLKISERKDPETEECPYCLVEGSVTLIIKTNFEIVPEHAVGRIRPHRDWQEHLNRIKRKNPGSDFTTW